MARPTVQGAVCCGWLWAAVNLGGTVQGSKGAPFSAPCRLLLGGQVSGGEGCTVWVLKVLKTYVPKASSPAQCPGRR